MQKSVKNTLPDTLKGIVTKIIDCDTFELNVLEEGDENLQDYKEIEVIQIANLISFEMEDPGEIRSAYFLKRILKEREVLCVMLTIDEGGLVVAKVYPL